MPRKHFAAIPGNRHFWFLMSNIAVTTLASTMVTPFASLYLYNLGISVGAVSVLFFVSGLWGTLTTILAGWLSDRVGRRKIYAFGTASSAVYPALLSLTTSFNQALPVISLEGVMDSSSRTAQTTIIADQVDEERRTTAFGVSRIVTNCAWIVGPFIGGVMLVGHLYRSLFRVALLIGVVGLALFLVLVPESRKAGLATPRLPKLGVLRDHELLVLCVASFCAMLFYTQYYSLLPIYAAQIRGVNSIGVGLLFSISGATVVVFQLPTSVWLQRIPHQLGYVAGVVVMAAGITGLALAPNFDWLLFAVFVMTLGENMFFPIAFTLVTTIANESDRGMYVGVLGLFLSLGANFSPLLGGTVWQLTGNPNLPWLMSPIYAALSVLMTVIFRASSRRNRGVARASGDG